MGQQQLLLIVLGVIIVGIAVVLGITMFSAQSDASSRDSLTSDLLSLSSMAVAYYHKPAMLGGGGNSFVGWKVPDYFQKYENGKIKYRLQTKKDRLVITGIGNENGNDGSSKMRMKIFVYQDHVEYTLVN